MLFGLPGVEMLPGREVLLMVTVSGQVVLPWKRRSRAPEALKRRNIPGTELEPARPRDTCS